MDTSFILCKYYRGNCKYGDKCKYSHDPDINKICQICNEKDRYRLTLSVCQNCINHEFTPSENNINYDLLPSEIMKIISYYVINISDNANLFKSGLFSTMNNKSYWVNKVRFYLGEFYAIIAKELLERENTFVKKLLFFNNYVFFKNCMQTYFVNYLQNNDLIHKSDNVVEITYHRHETTHDGYCSGADIDDEFENDIILHYELPFGINELPKIMYHREFEYCQRGSGYCGTGTEYEIKNVKYLKVGNKLMCTFIDQDAIRCENIVNGINKRCNLHVKSFPIIYKCDKCKKFEISLDTNIERDGWCYHCVI